MASSSPKADLEQLFCSIRRTWVTALPEEKIRQSIIHRLCNELGYPPGSIAVEKGLRQIPHLKLSAVKLPLRRADIICFRQGQPFLLIECKAVKLTPSVIRQVIGYNVYLQAPFVAIANQDEVRYGWFDKTLGTFRFVEGLPAYQALPPVL